MDALLERYDQAHTQSIASIVSLDFCQVGEHSCIELGDGLLKSCVRLTILV